MENLKLRKYICTQSIQTEVYIAMFLFSDIYKWKSNIYKWNFRQV